MCSFLAVQLITDGHRFLPRPETVRFVNMGAERGSGFVGLERAGVARWQQQLMVGSAFARQHGRDMVVLGCRDAEEKV